MRRVGAALHRGTQHGGRKQATYKGRMLSHSVILAILGSQEGQRLLDQADVAGKAFLYSVVKNHQGMLNGQLRDYPWSLMRNAIPLHRHGPADFTKLGQAKHLSAVENNTESSGMHTEQARTPVDGPDRRSRQRCAEQH